MGIYQDKKGKKFILMLGLIVALIGLILPMVNGMYGIKVEFNAGEYFNFYVILLSILLLCSGATIIQVVGNPVMRDVSPEGAYSKNPFRRLIRHPFQPISIFKSVNPDF